MLHRVRSAARGAACSQVARRDDPLGAQSSFRCFEHDVVCDPDRPRELGPHYNCKPREDSPYVRSISEYVLVERHVRVCIRRGEEVHVGLSAETAKERDVLRDRADVR